MNSSDQPPKLPLWIFFATDLALIGAAAFIALRSAEPLTMEATLAIVACLGVGAIVGLVPLVLYFERIKNEQLDERQRALEALARTVSSSAEQISIAASGLHGIAELAQKNLRQAEQLPHKLHEKVAEFQAQIATADDTEKEELERELLALRTTESERLESVSQRIAKSAAEWAKLEQATQQHLAAAQEALAKLSLGSTSGLGQNQAATEPALDQARIEAARAIEAGKASALDALDKKLAQFLAALDARLLGAANPNSSASPPSPREADATAEPAAVKRSRRPRREDDASAPTPTPPRAEESVATPAADELPRPIVAIEEPPPIPEARIAEIEPVAPNTAEPFSGRVLATPSSAPAPATVPAGSPLTPASEQPTRKRPARKAQVDDEPSLGLQLDDMPADRGAEPIRTPDGATRLLVTAYIGIGNRLFIRGAGPGLSWEKGVPLQFVSIGKWRWETSEASGPVQFKLYKNDEIECALGTQTLELGQQQEVSASF